MIDIEAEPDLTPDDDAAADRLIAFADSAGLEPTDLDEWVHDAASRYASDECNSAGSDGDDEFDDAAHDEAGRQAADLNNSGLGNQIRYLVSQYGAEDTEAKLRAAAQAA